MIQDNNFIFRISISVNSYSSKKDIKLCLSNIGAKSAKRDKLAFYNNVSINLDDLEQASTSGYAFCNLFKYDKDKKYYRVNTNPRYKFEYTYEYPEYKYGNNKGAMKLQFKSDEFFDGSQCIFIDIDKTKYKNLNEYVKNLTNKPTFAYCTYSDTPNDRRFRLIYIFNEILDEYEFYRVSVSLSKQIEIDTGEILIDKCGTKGSQYFNGTMNNKEIYRSDFIYSKTDFQGDYKKATKEIYVAPSINLNFIADMERLEYDEFMRNYHNKYKFFWRVEKNEWINNSYQYVDGDYFSLYFNTTRLKDGMCRRRKLYQRMCLRRIIKPDTTPEEILFNAYLDLFRYIDNSEDPITIQDLVRNVNSCFKYSVNDIKNKFSEIIEKAKISTKPKNGKIYKDKYSIKKGNYSEISLYYDSNLSIKENLTILHNNGIKISERSLYNYCNDNNIKTKTKLTDEEIFNLLDLSLSLRKNSKMLLDSYGIEISIGKIHKIIKEYNI